ncbi:MAG TPA: SUMF1/EgtB/PvdO family nonheme iron enzyme [Candidatus Binatia bacterium]|nr:SUMF1/EgtB/PvdO family nonheme iron enzyme [Candidatus Binatia bacterium]
MTLTIAILDGRGLLSVIMMLLLGWGSARAQSRRSTEMVDIPAGLFIMGSNDGPEDERPAHHVSLRAFTFDRTPVTNEQFADFLNAVGVANVRGDKFYDTDDGDARIHRRGGKWVADPGFENHPVVEVSWFGAREYCAWAGKRLPTEAEWEKAARGSDGRKFPWGNSPPDQSKAQFNAGWNQTAPVDSFPSGASPYGILDLAGNAWEWVSSAYLSYPYNPADGREELKPGPVRGTRGGGHDSPPQELTTTQRGKTLSRNFRSGHHNIGFRCAR